MLGNSIQHTNEQRLWKQTAYLLGKKVQPGSWDVAKQGGISQPGSTYYNAKASRTSRATLASSLEE